MHVLGHRGRDDLLGGEPDALVDDLEPGVAGPHGDLLGAVAVPVEPRLADEQPQPLAELLAGPARPARAPAASVVAAAARADADRAADTPVGARYSPNTSRSARPTPPSSRPARAQRSEAP